MNLKALGAILLIAALTFTAVYAVTQWTGVINWTVQSEQFSVWDQASDGTEITSGYTDDLGLVAIEEQFVLDLYLQNDGDVAITVTVSDTPSGCTAQWNSATGWNIPIGQRVLAQLTLTITGAGSYSWQFQIA